MNFARTFLIYFTIAFMMVLPVHAKDMVLKEPPKSLNGLSRCIN